MTTTITKEKIIITFLVAIILLLLGYFLLFRPPEKKVVYMESESKDTLITYVMQYPEPIRIQGKARIIYKEVPTAYLVYDTLYETKPFTAVLDTIVRDTFSIRYEYPENIFSFVLRQTPDTMKIETITIEKIIEKPKAWYDETWFKVATYATAILGTVYIMKNK